MQEPHEMEILVLFNGADMSIAEIYTNDSALAAQLELQGCRRDYVLFEETSLRAHVGQQLPHLFIVASGQIVLSALQPVFQATEQLAWRRISSKGIQHKRAAIRLDKQRKELAERAAYERQRQAKMTEEHKGELEERRRQRQKQWTPEQREAAKERSRRYMANRSPEKKAEQTEQKRLNEIRRRAKLNEQEVSPCA